jgi:O-antigen ligase
MALWIRGALAAVLFLVPLPFGSVEEGAIFAFETATLLLFALHVRFAVGRSRDDDPGEHAPLPAILKFLPAVFFGIATLQILPLPSPVLKILSPQAFRIQAEASAVAGGGSSIKSWGTLSLVPSASFGQLLLFVCCFLFGYLVWSYIRTKKDLELFVWTLLAGAAFQAFYGLAGFLSGSGKIWGYAKVYYLDSATGTFINRNHFSGYLEMIFPISLGYVLAKADFFSMKPGSRIKERLLWFSQDRLQKAFMLSLVSVLIGLGIFFSRSRTGIFILFATLFLLAMTLSAFGDNTKKRSLKVVRIIILAVLAAAVFVGVDPIIERFATDNIDLEGRPVIFADSLDLIGRFPFAGVGLGGFVYAYPTVRTIYNPSLIDHAHNDYLEVAAEAGLIAVLALAAAAVLALVWTVRRWRKRHDPLVRAVTLGAILGIVAILIHGLTDFNLQIPANAATFAAIFAIALAGVDCGKIGWNSRA